MRTLRTIVALSMLALGTCNGACNGTAPSPTSEPRSPTASTTAPEAGKVQGQPQSRGDAQPPLPLGSVELEAAPRAPIKLRVEVASTPAQQQMGLMFRETLADDAGMLFMFGMPRHNSFWMRNTLLPLDMFFIDEDWNVVGVVENAEPLTETPREVKGISQYVLEVNAGFAKKHALGAGTKVRYTPPQGVP